MKYNAIYYMLLLAIGLSASFTSCNDFLDKLPDNRTELDTDQKISKLLISAYPEVSPNSLFELYSDNSDDNGPKYSYYQLSEVECFNWQDTQEEYQDTPNNLWQGYYMAVASANLALKAIEEQGNPERLNAQRGEALVCRAYSHFMLTMIFCNAYTSNAAQELGIPYMEDIETTVSPQYSRGTLEEVYQKIEKDLLDGMPLISDDNYSIPKYHFTKKAAYAFAARFYMNYMKTDFSNCDKVIDYATRVLGNNATSQLRDWEAFSKLSGNDNVQPDVYIASTNKANLLIGSTASNWGVILSNYMVGKRYLHNKLIASSETAQSSGLWGGASSLYVKPFTTTGYESSFIRKSGAYEGSSYYHYMPILFSTDEILLYRAEAYALKKNYNQAAADITSWKKAYTSNKQELTPEAIDNYYKKIAYYSPLEAMTPKKKLHPAFSIEAGMQENIIQCILHVRRIATLHEGIRWPDIKRYGIVIYRRLITDGYGSVTDEMPVNDLRRAIQIPRNVILAGMKPNPRTNE